IEEALFANATGCIVCRYGTGDFRLNQRRGFSVRSEVCLLDLVAVGVVLSGHPRVPVLCGGELTTGSESGDVGKIPSSIVGHYQACVLIGVVRKLIVDIKGSLFCLLPPTVK